jgi:hypothetical protein
MAPKRPPVSSLGEMAALFTSASSRPPPSRSRISSMPRPTSSGSARSICTWFLSPPGHGQSALKGWRDTVITRQPPALNFFTVAWPMPRLAPVSTRVRALSRRGGAFIMGDPTLPPRQWRDRYWKRHPGQ